MSEIHKTPFGTFIKPVYNNELLQGLIDRWANALDWNNLGEQEDTNK